VHALRCPALIKNHLGTKMSGRIPDLSNPYYLGISHHERHHATTLGQLLRRESIRPMRMDALPYSYDRNSRMTHPVMNMNHDNHMVLTVKCFFCAPSSKLV